MSESSYDRRNMPASIIFNLLNPIPYGFFIAGWIFDIIYLYSTNVMWGKSASWLIALGLIFAIIPRLINLAQVWFCASSPQFPAAKIDFWLNVIAIISAIVNCFVHSRDAYAIAPQNVIYSTLTVICLLLANIISSSCHAKY
ncbi:hypothetical protein FR830_25350 (plasmid) [Klebsiella aerogenes]|uniref:DUF2231 domain-containing protein n=1 Tax=Klebsiella aerogenes TaxID=548 RepID=UPI00124D3B66|nr:DUF2231 domain-containing protein [Klebsiella aerogenes]QFI19934.1 hypothetical protein FR830_25350 [Klebsiella aerogenes]